MQQKALSKLKPDASFGPTSAQRSPGREQAPSISGRFKVNGVLAVGQEVNLALLLKNLTRDRKTVAVNMTAWTIVYNGTLVHEVWKDSVTISLDPEEGNLCYSWWVHVCEVVHSLLVLQADCRPPTDQAGSEQWQPQWLSLGFYTLEVAISVNSTSHGSSDQNPFKS